MAMIEVTWMDDRVETYKRVKIMYYDTFLSITDEYGRIERVPYVNIRKVKEGANAL